MTRLRGGRTLGRPLPSMSTKSGCAAARLRQAPYIASMLAASPPTSSTTYASTTHLRAKEKGSGLRRPYTPGFR